MNKVEGLHHIAITTANMKSQIEYFTDVLGMELVALYWMHGVPNTFHGFLRLNDESAVAFVLNPDIEKIPVELGKTHAGNPGAQLRARRDAASRIPRQERRGAVWRCATASARKAYPCWGRSTTASASRSISRDWRTCRWNCRVPTQPIDARAWIDPEVMALAGISPLELARYKKPADFKDQGGTVKQPGVNAPGPHMTNYPPGATNAFSRRLTKCTREQREPAAGQSRLIDRIGADVLQQSLCGAFWTPGR